MAQNSMCDSYVNYFKNIIAFVQKQITNKINPLFKIKVKKPAHTKS